MKITHVRVFVITPGLKEQGEKMWNLVLVKVYTDEGIEGVGEAFANGKARTTETAIYEFERWLKDKDPTEVLRHWYAYYRGSRYPQGTETMAALSAIEMALWDIAGKAVGLPVYKMLGGPVRDKIRVYRTTEYDDIMDSVDMGFTAVKFTPLYYPPEWEHMMPNEIMEISIDRVRKVREMVGDGIDLCLDYHGRSFSPTEAIQFARAIERYRLLFIEEPAMTDVPESLAEIKMMTTIPVAGGERCVSRSLLREILERRAVHVFQPDPSACGGIAETIRWAGAAEMHQIVMAPHQSCSPVQLAAATQIDACIPNFLIQECYVNLEGQWVKDLFNHPPVVENGYMQLNDRPGLGIELNDEVAEDWPFEPIDRPVIIQPDGAIGLE